MSTLIQAATHLQKWGDNKHLDRIKKKKKQTFRWQGKENETTHKRLQLQLGSVGGLFCLTGKKLNGYIIPSD